MKNLKLHTILAAALFTASSFTGNAFAFINVVPVENASKAVVRVSSPSNAEASIYIYDAAGTRLVSDMISPDASTKYYDFTNLPDGIYTFESFSDYISVAKEIGVSNSRVEILSVETEFKPYFLVEDDKLRVSFLNQDMKDMEFSIESVTEIFYQETEGSDMTLNKKFNISNLRAGEYYATLKVEGKTFYHYFSVN